METVNRLSHTNGVASHLVNEETFSDPTPVYRKPFNRPLFLARLKYWLWAVVTKSIITFVYLAVISQGLRYVLPELGMRLYKIPGFAFLQHYKMTYRLDLAYVFALVPLVGAWVLWHFNLQAFLAPERFAALAADRQWNVERARRVVLTMGAIIIIADAACFYAAFVLTSWGGSKFSAGALLATTAYVTILGFVTFVSMYLGETVNSLKKDQ